MDQVGVLWEAVGIKSLGAFGTKQRSEVCRLLESPVLSLA